MSIDKFYKKKLKNLNDGLPENMIKEFEKDDVMVSIKKVQKSR